jgi:glycosyltransferase involved in cell wall biosynthesis
VFSDKLSIIIPAIDEEKSIGEIISKSKKYSKDVIIIDGHSKDRTREIAESLGAKVYLDNGKGKGDAIRVGMQKSDKDIIVFIDADGSHDPNDIPKLIAPIIEGKADHVSASRMRGGSDELHGDIKKFIRMVGSDIITLGINYRFGVRLTDSQNGFRAIKRKVALSLNLRENITTIEQEMIIRTLRRGYKIAEVPSHEYARKHGTSSIVVSRIWWRYVFSWLKYLFVG